MKFCGLSLRGESGLKYLLLHTANRPTRLSLRGESGLKSDITAEMFRNGCRLSLRGERGLKSWTLPMCPQWWTSLPSRGEWIEI